MIYNIIIGLVVIGITVTIQGYGTNYWLKKFLLKYSHLEFHKFNKKTVKLLITTALFLLALNFIEAIVWGFVYFLTPTVPEFETLEKAIYFSLVTFTSLGYGEITISSSHRLLTGFEAMNGILLLGWSTTMMFTVSQYIWSKINDSNNK